MKPVLFGILLSLFTLAANAQPSSGEKTWRFKVFLDKKAIEKVYAIKGADRRKPFSFLCPDLSEISQAQQRSMRASK